MNKSSFLLALIVIGGAGFAAGYFVSNRSPQPADAGASNPAEATREFAELVRKNKGPFKDPLEKLRIEQKLEAARASLVKGGPEEFLRIVAALGDRDRSDAPGTVGGGGSNIGEPDAEVREALITVLPEIDPARAAPYLAERLLDTNEQGRVRASAAGLLAHLDRKVAIPALTKSLDAASKRSWAGARAVVDALVFIGGDDAGDAMLKALMRSTTDLTLRIALTESVGTLHYAPAWDALENLVRFEESDHYVRRAAMRSLLQIDPPRALALARDQIPVEKDPPFQEFLRDVERTQSVVPAKPR